MAAFRYIVRGRVQGVGYRYFALREAERLGVAGFARNLPDGTVELVVEGSDEVLAQYEDELRKGPAFSAVENVERTPVNPRGSEGFHIR